MGQRTNSDGHEARLGDDVGGDPGGVVVIRDTLQSADTVRKLSDVSLSLWSPRVKGEQ